MFGLTGAGDGYGMTLVNGLGIYFISLANYPLGGGGRPSRAAALAPRAPRAPRAARRATAAPREAVLGDLSEGSGHQVPQYGSQ